MPLPRIDLAHHRRLRKLLRRHHDVATKTVTRAMLDRYGRGFGLLEGDQMRLNSEDELVILYDFILYAHRQEGQTVIQRYLAGLPASDDPDEQLLRQGMAQARAIPIEVRRRHRSGGMVTVQDLARQQQIIIVDEALSRSAEVGQHLAYRVMPMPNYWMPTGAGFPLDHQVVYVLEGVYLPWLRRRYGQDLARMPPEAEDALSHLLTQAGFEEGTTSDIGYV